METKKVRNIKVISQSGRNYKPTPTIILKGQWLNEMGFEIGNQIKVECENGKLVITNTAKTGKITSKGIFIITEVRQGRGSQTIPCETDLSK